jgi:hypothetical protein
VLAGEGVVAPVSGVGAGAWLTGAGGAALLAARVSATRTGVPARLAGAGLTAEPTSTPKASSAITATAAAHGAGM